MEPKKDPNIDLERRKAFFFFGGLLVSLGIVLIAFEWKTFEEKVVQDQKLDLSELEEEVVEPTEPEKPEQKQQQTQEVEVVEEEEDIEDELDLGDMDIDEDSEFDFEDEGDEVKEEKIFMAVQDEPTFPGGEREMQKYIQEHLRYPDMAKEMDVQGVVYITFVVWKDGSIRNIQVRKGIGAGCDKEAKRVVENMPSWQPGKQRGRAVPVQISIPIRFQLN